MFIKKMITQLFRSLGFELKRYAIASSTNYRAQRFFSDYKFDTVLDVGAYDGTYAMSLRNLGFKGRIISFEPLSKIYPKILGHSKNDINWIVPPRMAIGAKEGVKSINIAANYTSSSIKGMEDAHLISAPESKFVGSELVNVYSLDKVAGEFVNSENVVFLKLDVQGYETEVLKGAQKILPIIKGMQIELSLIPLYKDQLVFKQMLSYIEKLGYQLWDMQPCFRDKVTGQLLQIDGIFIRND